MTTPAKNYFLDYYGQHGISPVSQDISDLDAHVARRVGLYRTLGLAPIHFKGRRVLEVGPGSGHNSIVTARLDPAHYTLAEPNPAGFAALRALFEREGLLSDAVDLQPCASEDLPQGEPYDIVLAEGMLSGVGDQRAFLASLLARCAPGSILVVTCVDPVSYFFETIRRALALRLTAEVSDFHDKVELLAAAFEPHLQALTGASRPVVDWVQDNLLNTAAAVAAASNAFSIDRCLELLGEAAFVCGASPSLFADWTWYKRLPADPGAYNARYRERYWRVLHNLIDCRITTSARDADANRELHRLCYAFNHRVEQGLEHCTPDELGSLLVSIRANLQAPEVTERALAAAAELLADPELTPAKVAAAGDLCPAFGRGQQYLSLEVADPNALEA